MFIQPCFIRKNTSELRKRLIQIGRKLNHGKAWGKNLVCFRSEDTNEDLFVASPDFDLKNAPEFKKMIDCGTNEELFLALAALRDDTDVNQWFTNGNTWKNCMLHKADLDSWNRNFGFGTTFVHKATAKELVEHFKDVK